MEQKVFKVRQEKGKHHRRQWNKRRSHNKHRRLFWHFCLERCVLQMYWRNYCRNWLKQVYVIEEFERSRAHFVFYYVVCHSLSDLLPDCKIVIEELAKGQHVSPEGEWLPDFCPKRKGGKMRSNTNCSKKTTYKKTGNWLQIRVGIEEWNQGKETKDQGWRMKDAKENQDRFLSFTHLCFFKETCSQRMLCNIWVKRAITSGISWERDQFDTFSIFDQRSPHDDDESLD